MVKEKIRFVDLFAGIDEIRSTDKLTHYLRVKCDEIISERDVESFRNGKEWINKWV